jgi:hypothetical protein
MKNVSPQTLAALQQDLGTEPILVIGVEWTDGSQEVLYSDQRIDGADYPYPVLTQVGSFDTALIVTGSGDSQSISVTLDDVDGRLKSIFNSHDIHKRPVKVYHHFRGLQLDYKFLVFQGEINSPVNWNEGERTLSFTILTHTEDLEVAFSMEEGDFPAIPDDALGTVWPLVFGQVCNMQAQKVRSPLKGYLTAGEGWHDFTIHTRLCQARYIQCPSAPMGEVKTIEPATNGGYDTVSKWEYGPDTECLEDRFEVICNLLFRLDQETAYENATITIRDGVNFPQGEVVTVSVDGALLTGQFSGNTFTVSDRRHPEYDDWDHDTCAPVQDHAYGIKQSTFTNQWKSTNTGTAWYHDQTPVETLADCDPDNGIWRQGPVGGPTASWKAYDDMESADFAWRGAGTEVFLEADKEILFIVSLLPGTVDSVTAYKEQPSGRRLLMEVPSAYYTVYNTDYIGYDVVEIGMSKRLSQFDSAWGDDIYVSFTSDVGPNPIDTIEWLLDKYTELTPDATSFAAVGINLANYPCNFWVKSRRNVLDLIHDIAYQTRCALSIRNGVVYITYLSEEPSSVRTITESDIISETFLISLTETEDLVTKHFIDWHKTDAGVESTDETDLKIILKHNVNKYGITEESWDYYTQNTYDTVLKSATFWLIRLAHTWKYVEFDTPLKHLDLDIFDCVTLNVAQFSANPIKVIIEDSTYNPQTNTIHFKCWTPVLSGTDEVYSWAWPALQDAARRFPLLGEEENAGAGYDFTVTPPEGHPLRAGYIDTGDGPARIETSGDQNPSDIDDVYPTVTCDVSNTNEIEEDDPAFEALTLARSSRNRISEQQAALSAPPSGSDGDKAKERTTCGQPQLGDGCIYEVTVTYVFPVSVQSGKSLGGCNGGPCEANICGKTCTGPLSSMCHTFGAAFSAQMFYQSKQAEIQALAEGCGYCAGVTTYPFSVSAPNAIPDPSGVFGGCEALPGSPDSPNQGEPYSPRGA